MSRFKAWVAISVAAVSAICVSSAAHAWDDEGHMIVAAVAYERLDAPVRKKVDALLALNPNYKDWIKGVAKKDRGETAFLHAATWPDFIKRAKGYKNDTDTSAPAASQNVGYSDKLQHRYWHYVDIPFSPDGTALVQPVPPNAQTQIAVFRSTLTSNAANPLKSYDLVWLIHVVGDVHQPLHATSRFTHDDPQGDRGGGAVNVCPKTACEPLHTYWDDALGTQKTVAAAEKKAKAILADPANKPDPAAARNGDEKAWIEESFEAAKATSYADPVGPGNGPFTLTPAYKAAAAALAEKRVVLAGERLANLINEALK